jgi:glutamyl-tRNA reductase
VRFHGSGGPASWIAVICATGAAEPVVRTTMLLAAAARRSRVLAVIDLGVPRNVERPPSALPDTVHVADLADLTAALEAAAVQRRDAVADAEAIVAEELATWITWLENRASDGVRCYRRGTSAVR